MCMTMIEMMMVIGLIAMFGIVSLFGGTKKRTIPIKARV